MEAVIHQPLGQVVHLQASAAFERAQIKDALVCHPATGAPVEHREMGIQPLGDDVGHQQRHRFVHRGALTARSTPYDFPSRVNRDLPYP